MFSGCQTIGSMAMDGKKGEQIGIRCDPEWKKLVERLAAQERRKSSDFIRLRIDEWIAGQRPKDGLSAEEQQDLDWMMSTRRIDPEALLAAVYLCNQARTRPDVREALLAVSRIAGSQSGIEAGGKLPRSRHRGNRRGAGTE